jgi:hypothetical protein
MAGPLTRHVGPCFTDDPDGHGRPPWGSRTVLTQPALQHAVGTVVMLFEVGRVAPWVSTAVFRQEDP